MPQLTKVQKFLNLYQARNEAVKVSKGKYISFLDSDDKWLANKIEEQINFFSNNKEFKIVYSNYYIKRHKQKKQIKFKHELPQGKINEFLLKNYTIAIMTVCLDKKFFNKYLFDERYNIIGDFDLFIKLSKKFKIGYIKKPLAYYRIHKLNLSRNFELYIKELSYWLKKNKSYKSKLLRLRYYLFKLKIKLIYGRIVQW